MDFYIYILFLSEMRSFVLRSNFHLTSSARFFTKPRDFKHEFMMAENAIIINTCKAKRG